MNKQMKREILFRGKRLDDGEWLEVPNIIQGDNRAFAIIGYDYTSEKKPGNFYLIEVNPETVGQFTGLIDKNGTRIFEGDITRVPVCRLSRSNWYQKTNKNHGFVGDFVFKAIEFEIGDDSSYFSFKDMPITRKQICSIQQPRGLERGLQMVDDINFKAKDVEVIGNIHDQEASK